MDNFLVRVWVPADGSSPTMGLRGIVRHVATGTETPFRDDEEVLRVLRRQVTGHEGAPGGDRRPDGQKERDT